MKKYRSKISAGLLIFLIVILGGFFILMIYFKVWIGAAVILAVAGVITYLFIYTCYTIQGDQLTIRGSFVINKTIPIGSIKSIKNSISILSAPANSFDRLEIRFNKHDYILISPKKKDSFINQLTEVNPEIKVDVKGYKSHAEG